MWFWVLLALVVMLPVQAQAQTGSPFALIPRANVSVASVVATQSGTAANALDGNPGTMWLTTQACNTAPYCWIIFRFTQDYLINKLVYLPENTAATAGRIGEYHIFTTPDTTDCDINSTWTEVATGMWSNVHGSQKATWAPTTAARCLKLESRLSASGGTAQMHVGDMYFFEQRAYAAETPPAAAKTDFDVRCTAAGVTACYGFDEAPVGVGADHFKDAFGVDRGVNIVDSGIPTLPTWDQHYKTSGGGSLRFTAPPPPHDAEDIAGQFIINPTSNVSIAGADAESFGPNEDMYFQFRRRVSSEAMFNSWVDSGGVGVGMKFFSLYRYPTPCADLQLVMGTYFDTEMISGYTTCGGTWGFITASDLETKVHATPYWLNQGDYTDCQYQSFNNCFQMRPDTWQTYYCKFHIGTLTVAPTPRVPDSSVECWVADQGATVWTKVFNVTKEWSLGSSGTELGFNSLFMSMYMTDMPAGAGDPGVTSIINIDEVIFSTQPIAIPGLSVNAPPVSGAGLGSGGGSF